MASGFDGLYNVPSIYIRKQAFEIKGSLPYGHVCIAVTVVVMQMQFLDMRADAVKPVAERLCGK